MHGRNLGKSLGKKKSKNKIDFFPTTFFSANLGQDWTCLLVFNSHFSEYKTTKKLEYILSLVTLV